MIDLHNPTNKRYNYFIDKNMNYLYRYKDRIYDFYVRNEPTLLCKVVWVYYQIKSSIEKGLKVRGNKLDMYAELLKNYSDGFDLFLHLSYNSKKDVDIKKLLDKWDSYDKCGFSHKYIDKWIGYL